MDNVSNMSNNLETTILNVNYGDTIRIGEVTIYLKKFEYRGYQETRFVISAPKEIKIFRKELLDKIRCGLKKPRDT